MRFGHINVRPSIFFHEFLVPSIISAPRQLFGAPGIFARRNCRQLLSGATTEQVQKGLDELFGPFHEVGAVKS